MKHGVSEELLTAYALGELGRIEQSRVEKAVRNNPVLLDEVESLKRLDSALRLEFALTEDELPSLTSRQRRRIEENLTSVSVVERFRLQRIFEWKVVVPALCVSVLAIALFLELPRQLLNDSGESSVNNTSLRPDSLVMTDMSKAGVMGNRAADEIDDKAVIMWERDVTGRPAYDYRPNSRYGGFAEANRIFKRPSAMQLINSGIQTRRSSSQYNLADYDIIFRNTRKPSIDRGSYELPVNLNSGSYNIVREALNKRHMPQNKAIKIEEMINRFNYNHSSPGGHVPFSVIMEISRNPWNNSNKLMHIRFSGVGTGLSGSAPTDQANSPVIARNVKIRLEFNPDKVGSYRHIGYEDVEDGNGRPSHISEMYVKELRAGEMPTVLFEITPSESGEDVYSNSLATLKLGYRSPDKNQWNIFVYPVEERDIRFDQTSESFRFSAAVAAFGMLLKGSEYSRDISYNDVVRIAEGSMGKDIDGRRSEFVRLVKTARVVGKR